MKYSYLLSLLVFTFLLWGCQGEDQSLNDDTKTQEAALAKKLIGTWEAISFNVVMSSYLGGEKDSLFEITENYWTEKFQVKPVQTKYRPDSTYIQEYKTLEDTLISANRGRWYLFGDTLMMIEPNASYNYTIELDKGMATFRSLLDWDGDGQEDDDFTGKYRLISISY